MHIGRKDLLWNYAATSMRFLLGIIVMPITLRLFPSEEVGLWGIFTALIPLPSLLDFGFSNSFSRSITYIFSGVKELKTQGFAVAQNAEIDYGLLKNLLSAVKRYYGMVSLIFLTIFAAVTPFYMPRVLHNFEGNTQTVWFAWFVLGGLLAYELYTYCYNALLMGRGMVKRSMQITVLSQSVRIILTVTFLFCGLRLIALVLGMLAGDLLNRVLLRASFYDRETKKALALATSGSVWGIIKTLAPNALKTGFVVLGNFVRTYVLFLITPFYLSLSEIGELDVSRKVISLIVNIGFAWFLTFYAKIAQYHVQEDVAGVKRLYIKGKLALIAVFAVAGSGLLFFGSDFLRLIKSNTPLLCNGYLLIMLVFSFLEANQSMANHVFITKNQVPFYKADLISGFFSFVALMVMLYLTSWGVLNFILASGLIMCAYLNWKIPVAASKELKMTTNDYKKQIEQLWKKSIFMTKSRTI